MHVRRALALALAVPLLLAGCTGEEPTPNIPDPTTSSPTTPPPESETPEAESAEDFIRRWAAIEADMENTGDTAAYRAVSEGCRACEELADLVEEYYAAGGFVKWRGWDVRSIRQRGDSNVFVVSVDSAPTTYATKQGAEEESLAGGPGRHLLTLRQAGSSWVVTEKSEIAR